MTDLMKLATDYAQACYNLANPDSYDAERAEEARAALQSAIEALQKEVSTLDVLLEECKMDWSGDVTQIKAEHKREIEALQSECAEHKENAIRNARQAVAFRAERDQLQSQLDAMGKGEPVAWVTVEEGVCISTRSANFRHIPDGQYQLYAGPLQVDVAAAIAAPNALAPSREVIGRYMADKGFYLSKEALDGLMLKLEGIGGAP